MTRLLGILVAMVLATSVASTGELTVPATVLRVIDGDTLEVDARPWPGVTIRTLVRIRGIDTPELNGRCVQERTAATAARDALLRLTHGATVTLSEVTPDKYGGRVVAHVRVSGEDLGARLQRDGHARPYGHRASWCPP